MGVLRLPADELAAMVTETGLSERTVKVLLIAWLRRAGKYPIEGDAATVELRIAQPDASMLPVVIPKGRLTTSRAKVEIGEDYAPPLRAYEWACGVLGSAVEVDREVEKFRAYHRGRGNRFARPDQAFQTWIHNAVEWRNRRGGLIPSPTVDQAARTRPRWVVPKPGD